MKDKIDIVILWVDGADPAWLKEKNKYSPKKIDITDSIIRYRDYGTLKYIFRGIEKNMPWINKIHFVTWGHLPTWLNTDNPKLHIVNHKDFIPQKYLPTFSANPIELNIHRIEGLSNKFIYFNDDMFVMRPLKPEYFFKKGLPTDVWTEDIMILNKKSDLNFAYILVNDAKVINSHFNKHECIKKYPFKYLNYRYGVINIKNILLHSWKNISPRYFNHTQNAFLKETFEEVWKKEPVLLDNVCQNKFRADNDINQYVMIAWQIYSGKFMPKSPKKRGKTIVLSENMDLSIITDKKVETLCINDSDVKNFEKIKNKLIKAFEQVFPEKSSFER